MKAGKILLAAAFALTLAVSANAGIHVWWEAADGSIGAQGQTLNLECAAGARCEWDLAMYLQLDGGDENILGWYEDLLVDSGLAGIVTVKAAAVGSESPFTALASGGDFSGVEDAGWHILNGAGGAGGSGYIYGPLLSQVLTITLSVDGASAGVIDILSEGGRGVWIANDINGSYPYVDFFGAQDSVYGSYGAVRTNAAISINVVPEPTTVAFLGLGALALIRRRR